MPTVRPYIMPTVRHTVVCVCYAISCLLSDTVMWKNAQRKIIFKKEYLPAFHSTKIRISTARICQVAPTMQFIADTCQPCLSQWHAAVMT